MPGNREKVGELYVEIPVKGVPEAVSSLRNVQTEFDKTTEAAQRADRAAGNTGFSGTLKEATKPMRDFRQAILGVVSSIFGWTAAISVITGAITGLITLLGKLGDSLSGFKKVEQQVDAALERTNSLLSERVKRISELNLIPARNPAAIKAAEEEIRVINEQIAALEKQRNKWGVAAPSQLAIDARIRALQRERDASDAAKFLLNMEQQAKRIRDNATNAFDTTVDVERERSAREAARVESELLRQQSEEKLKRLDDVRKKENEVAKMISEVHRAMIRAEVKSEIDGIGEVMKARLDAIEKVHAASLQSLQQLQAAQGSTFNRTLEGIAANVSALKTTISLRSRSVN